MADIFVFGSNLAGIHGAGSAKAAHEQHGAIWGKGAGIQGRSYAIPTKDIRLHSLPIRVIKMHVEIFKEYARSRPNDTFNVVAIGCGYAGYRPEQIGPLFYGSPLNVKLPLEFQPYL